MIQDSSLFLALTKIFYWIVSGAGDELCSVQQFIGYIVGKLVIGAQGKRGKIQYGIAS